MGDFNVNYLKQKDDVGIKIALTTYGFTQVVKKPTRTKCISLYVGEIPLISLSQVERSGHYRFETCAGLLHL